MATSLSQQISAVVDQLEVLYDEAKEPLIKTQNDWDRMQVIGQALGKLEAAMALLDSLPQN